MKLVCCQDGSGVGLGGWVVRSMGACWGDGMGGGVGGGFGVGVWVCGKVSSSWGDLGLVGCCEGSSSDDGVYESCVSEECSD